MPDIEIIDRKLKEAAASITRAEELLLRSAAIADCLEQSVMAPAVVCPRCGQSLKPKVERLDNGNFERPTIQD